jgi:DnaJ-domain-containing protein 1
MAYEEQDPRRLIVRLAVAVMLADGRITAPEYDAMAHLDRLGLGPLSGLVEQEVERASVRPIDLVDTCEGLADASPQAAAVILTLLAEVAASDGTVSGRELATFNTAAKQLGLSSIEADHILDLAMSAHKARFVRDETPARGAREIPPVVSAGARPSARPLDLQRAYRTLGITAACDRERVDAAYMALVERYNPAQLAAFGPEFAVLAVRKLAELTAAFEVVRRAAGREG